MIVLPEDLGSTEGRLYIHDAEQLKWAAIGVEDARIVEMVEMSMLQYRHLSGDLSKDRKQANLATEVLLSASAIVWDLSWVRISGKPYLPACTCDD